MNCVFSVMSFHAALTSPSSVYSTLLTVLELKTSNHEIHPACISPSTQRRLNQRINHHTNISSNKTESGSSCRRLPIPLSAPGGDIPTPSEDVSLGLETGLLFLI